MPTPPPDRPAYREPAPAKINLALHVRGRRDDGYHDIETIFAFSTDGDMVSAHDADTLSLEVNGPFAGDLEGDDNLVLRAAQALRDATGHEGGARLMLDKALPVASGIGGGSADAAATLRLLTRLWGTETKHVSMVAVTLGADVPACVLSMTARGKGIGDILSPIDVPELASTPILLVNPGVALSTASVFEAWGGEDGGPLPADWRDGRNDLEVPARSVCPQIGEVIDWLSAQPGVSTVRMSGSGATCFALFEDEAARDAAAAACRDTWWHLATYLR